MNKKSGTLKDAADKLVRGIKRKTRKHYSAEEKIRVVLAGLRGEESIAALNRGQTLGTAQRGQIMPEELQDLMAGGQELVALEGSLGGTV